VKFLYLLPGIGNYSLIRTGMETNLPTQKRSNKVFMLLVIIIVAGLSITIWFTVANEYYPRGKTVILRNGTDIDFIFTREDNFLVPIRAYFLHENSNVLLKFYFNNASNYYYSIQAIMLSSTSNSIFTVRDEEFTNQIRNGLPRNGTVTAAVEVGHPLNVSTYREPYSIHVFYKKVPRSTPPAEIPNALLAARLQHEPLDFIWSVRTLDFGKPTYFWIVFAGVLVSRIFSFSRTEGAVTTVKLDTLDLIWIPVSAVITLLIFSSFREQVNLTTDIMTNLALAFGFGFGFDKIF
jgi:hypothetical protein